MYQTVFHHWHKEHGARFVEFGEWRMPVQYSSIVDEHQAVRRRAGLFDISHMGRIEFLGPDRVPFLDMLLTNNVADLQPGQVRYSLVCGDHGGVLDDVLVTRLDDSLWSGPAHVLVVNASNREKLLDWIDPQLEGYDVEIFDRTATSSMLALQGPRSVEVAAALVDVDPRSLKYYTARQVKTPHGPVILSRTGYTGEDGFEVFSHDSTMQLLWPDLYEAGRSVDLRPCGLGARDVLRLEAGMPLYGHELNEQIDPLTAGLAFAVKLAKPGFRGQEALREIAAAPIRQTRVGLELAGKRIAREGAEVLWNGAAVGTVTSGTFSPTLSKSIAMAYVSSDRAAPGTDVDVDVRGQRETARVVPLPFYSRTRGK